MKKYCLPIASGISLCFATLICVLFTNIAGAQTSSDPPLTMSPSGDTNICLGQSLTLHAELSASNPIGVDPGSSGNGGKYHFSDDMFGPVTNIGFPFVFYGDTFTQCVISSNDYISFNLAYANGYSPWAINAPAPDASTPLLSIMCPWQDILPSTTPGQNGIIQYQTIGQAPNRVFVAEYCNIPMFSCTDMFFTDQIKIFEGSNIIEMHIRTKPICDWNGGAAIQGLSKDATTAHIVPGRNYPDQWSATNDGYRFTPDPNDPNNYIMSPIPYSPFLMNVTNDSIYWYAEGSSTPIGQGTDITVTPNGATYYYAEISSGGDCNGVVYTDTIFVGIGGTHYDTASAAICQGQTYNFHGKIVFQPGTYDTVIANPNGCDTNFTLYLSLNPLPNVNATATNPRICAGDSTVLNIANPSPNTTYQWLKNGTPISNESGNYLIVSDAGDYTLTGVTDKGCTDTSNTITISLSPAADAEILGLSRSADDLCLDDTITISAKEYANYQYHWSPEKYFRSNSSYFYPNATVTVSDTKTQIQLMAMNAFGCRAYDSMVILAHPCCDVYMPTAFTPNGDGNNDYFFPLLRPYQQIVSFKIFDRYGKMVYDNDNPQKGWNGNYPNGEKAPTDTYMYMIKYTCTDGQVYTDKNDITLVR